jgi:alpha-tubulin suppressor-like RCC1 family protein
MSRPTLSWFRLAVPAMLVIASIVGGLGPVPGASGQAVATTTPTAVVATTPVMAVASGTVTVTVTIPVIEATVVATPTRVPSGGLPTGTATVVAIGTMAVATATHAISVGVIEPPMAATPTLVQAGGLPTGTATDVASGTMAVATATNAILVGDIEPPVDASGHPGMPVGIGARAKPPQPGPVGMAAASSHPASMGESAARFMDVATGPFTALAAGYAHTCGLAYGGIAYCWGFNGNGELGDGTAETPRTAPVAVNGGHFFTSIVAGYYHTCGLAQRGRTYCWGDNGNGQLGDGTTGQQSTPEMVSGGLTFESLAAGQLHTCGLTADGKAYCWGYNGHGQIGDGTSELHNVPVAVSGGTSFTKLVAGDNHTCGLAAGGKAYCWGSNWYGQLGDGTTTDRLVPLAVSGGITFTSLVAGYNHACGLAWGGKAYCWGANFFGQLGDDTSGTNRSAPVAGAGWPTFTSLAAGQSHTCGLLPTGTAYCWGSDQQGALGDGNAAGSRAYPATVSGGQVYTALTAGQYHSCGLSLGGTAFCWGYNAIGQLGDGTTTDHATPVAVNGGPTLTSLTAGGSHTCGLAWDRTAYCWEPSSSPFPIRGGIALTSLAAGGQHTCGLVTGGVAYCWGSNVDGQLGDGTVTDRAAPVAISGGLLFTGLVAGQLHTCGLAPDGKAYCWGYNAQGQLGDGTTTIRTAPVEVTGGRTYTSLVAGSAHTCGLDFGGVAYCWGSNTAFMLGDGTYIDRSVPVAVGGGRRSFAKLSAGGEHTCGLDLGGTAYCWGSNSHKQLGDDTTAYYRWDPWPVSGKHTYTSLVAGAEHTCGLLSNGTVFCWGWNESGQLGDGTTTIRTAPVEVTGGRTYTSLVAGSAHTCGLASGGTAFCWGGTPMAVGVWSVPAPSAMPAPTIHDIRVANVRDTSFTVSWITDLDATGVIRWGKADDIGAPYTVGYDNRGTTGLQTVHFFSISGLAPSTRYRFDVVSGARTDTNQGAHYLVMTGPTLDTSAPDIGSGIVSTRNGAAPASVVIHVSATGPSGTSAPLSSLITSADQKSWGLNLGNLRTVALKAPFPVTASTPVTVTADGGPDGTASITTTVAVLRAGTLALVLTGDVLQTLQAGWNLVALRATPATPTSASVVCTTLNMGTAGTAVELDRWVSGGWEGHRCGLPVNDFSLVPGSGYFIRLTRPETWTYRGAVITTPATLSLGIGWNLVGAIAISGTLSVASATCTQLNTVQAGTAVELDRWVDGGWEGHRCDGPGSDFTQLAGQGYFVRLTRPATWAPVGASQVSSSSVSR